MSPAVVVSRGGALATIALSNPAKRNAITRAMWQSLAHAIEAFASDETLRCIVLRGEGREAFSGGADIAEFASVRNSPEAARVYHGEYVQGALRAIGACPHPIVAMIQGACVGGGLEIACACDIRIAAESSRFGVPINRLGFPIAYDELEAILPVIGRSAALEILVEGRIWKAREAFQRKLVARVVPDDRLEHESYDAARRIAEGAPLVARWHKQFVRRLTLETPPLSDSERDENYAYFATEDYRIGYDAFLRKRKPKFVGR